MAPHDLALSSFQDALDVYFTLSAPEPSMLVLAAAGGLALAGRCWRKSASHKSKNGNPTSF
jgi:hypothetical protein